MKNILSLLLILFTVSLTFSQSGGRTLLRGKVIYKNVNVPDQNVINVTSEEATTTNKDGEFEIHVKKGDVVAFSSVNYKLTTVNIDDAIISNNRLVVEVNEKITELSEVVVSPENTEKFIKLQNENFKQVDYQSDYYTPVENLALSENERGMKYGINVVNIVKAIFKSQKENEGVASVQLKLSDVLRQVYDDDFFTKDLHIPSEKINEFLYYCDDKLPAATLLKKDNEFQLIDFLVDQSKEYLKAISSEN